MCSSDLALAAHGDVAFVGGRSDAGVEIVDGLKAGERVVTYGAYGVQDSAKVEQLAPAGAPASAPATPPAAKPEKP